MQRILGYAAVGAWFALSATTLAGFGSGSVSLPLVNLLMALVFALIGAFVFWRTTAFARVRREVPESASLVRLLRIEMIASLGMFAVGSLCAAAAAARVFGEGVAVFG